MGEIDKSVNVEPRFQDGIGWTFFDVMFWHAFAVRNLRLDLKRPLPSLFEQQLRKIILPGLLYEIKARDALRASKAKTAFVKSLPAPVPKRKSDRLNPRYLPVTEPVDIETPTTFEEAMEIGSTDKAVRWYLYLAFKQLGKYRRPWWRIVAAISARIEG